MSTAMVCKGSAASLSSSSCCHPHKFPRIICPRNVLPGSISGSHHPIPESSRLLQRSTMTETRKCLSHFLSAFPRSPWQRVFPDLLLVLPSCRPLAVSSGITCPINQTQHHNPEITCHQNSAFALQDVPRYPVMARHFLRAVNCSPWYVRHVTISQIRSNSLSFS